MKKPSSLRIGGFDFSVTFVPDLTSDDGKDRKLDGHIKHDKGIIRIEANMHPQALAQVLLHEILHELFIQIGRGDMREEVIDALAFGLHQVIRDNPELVRMVRKKGL